MCCSARFTFKAEPCGWGSLFLVQPRPVGTTATHPAAPGASCSTHQKGGLLGPEAHMFTQETSTSSSIQQGVTLVATLCCGRLPVALNLGVVYKLSKDKVLVQLCSLWGLGALLIQRGHTLRAFPG